MGLSDAELSILVTDDSAVRELNSRYRAVNAPTDVLSFPMEDPALMGDVVISIERARAQAGESGVTLERELTRLLVHGVLHLAGYDHARGGRQAAKMRKKEEELLEELKQRGVF